MLPFLIDRPGLQIGSGHALTYLAVLICVVLTPIWAARREGLDPRRVRLALLILALVTLAGGRLHFVANHPEFYATNRWTALLPWVGGYHIGGGIVALVLLAWPVTRWLRLPLGKFADALVVPLGLAIAVARLGCLLHGCCVGGECHYPWCIAFPAGSGAYAFQRELRLIPADAMSTAPLHPLQLYLLGAALGISCLGYWLEPRKRYDGQVALLGLTLFSLSTALLELLRVADGSSPMWGSLPQLVWTGIAMSVAAVVGLVVAELWPRGPVSAPLAAPAPGEP